MRKIIVLVLFLIISIPVNAQEKKTFTVGVLSDKLLYDAQPLLLQLQNEIKAVVGQDANLVFKAVLENNFNLTAAKSNYQTLINNDTDIILAFGVINAIILYQQKTYPKPVIVFGSINSDFINLPEDQETSKIDNITYIIAPLSYKKDLDVFKTLYDYKRIGIIVDDFLPEALPVQSLFDTYFSKSDAEYSLIQLSEDGNINASLNNVDAIYLAGGFYLNERQFDSLVRTVNSKKLPSFSAYNKSDVERGILATNQPENNISQFFRRIALNVEAIVNGTNPSDLPLFIHYKNKLSINYNTATQIDFPLRYSMLATADLIGGAIVSESEFSLSIVDIMNGVVDKNLSLEAEKRNIDLSTQDLKTAKSDYLPDIKANTDAVYIDPRVAAVSNGQNPEFSTSGNVVLKQLIYSESASANITIQDNLKNAQQEAYNSAQLDALLNASVAYFNALILKTNVRIQNQNLQVTKRNLELAEQNFEAGASGKSDVLRFKSQLAQNTQSLIGANNSLQQAHYTINQLMNNSIADKITIEDAELSKGIFKAYSYDDFFELLDNPKLRPRLVAFLVEEAKKNAPELKNITYNIDAIKRNYRLNDTGRFIPTVALQGQYNLAISRSGKGSALPAGPPDAPDGNYNVGLNVSLPVFQQNKRNIIRQTTKIQEEQLEIDKENIALNIEKNINDIVLDIVSQIANIEISKVSEDTAKESLDLTQNAYQNGAVPVIQLIDAQTNYLQAQLASATANYNYLLTSMQLERAIGYFFLMNTEADNQGFIQRANQFILNKN